jgi:hypothetical protein
VKGDNLMATDTQARETGNSAMIIALVALVLLVIGAFAFFGMGNRTADAPDTTTVVTQPSTPDVTIQAPPVVVGGGSGGGTTGGGTTGGGTSGGAAGGTTGGTGGGSSAP